MSDKLSERVSTDGPKPLSESAKAAILEIQDRTQREVIIPHYGTYHEQKKALFSQIKITNELREHCGKTEKLLVETQAKLAALLKPVERVSMSTEKADFEGWYQNLPSMLKNPCITTSCMKEAYRLVWNAALLKPQGETPEGGRPVVVASGDKELIHWANMGGAPIIINGVQLMCESNPRDVHKIYGSSHTSKKTMKPVCLVHALHESECEACDLEAKLAAYLPPSEPVSPLSETQQERADFARTNRSAWPNNSSESPLPQADDADEIELWADRMSSTFHTMNRIELVRAAWRAGKASR